MEELEKNYEDLKKNKDLIGSIDKDFFFDFVDYLISEREELEKKIDELVEEQDEREEYTHKLEEQLAKKVEQYLNDNLWLCEYLDNNYILKTEAEKESVKQYELGLTQGAYEKNLVWEDKIREKISWLVRGPYADKYQQGKIDGLQELLNKEDQGNE